MLLVLVGEGVSCRQPGWSVADRGKAGVRGHGCGVAVEGRLRCDEGNLALPGRDSYLQ